MRTVKEIYAIWARMHNPKTAADYRLSLTVPEMTRIPAGRTWIERWILAGRRLATPNRKQLAYPGLTAQETTDMRLKWLVDGLVIAVHVMIWMMIWRYL